MYLEDKVTVLRDTVYSSSSLFHQSVHYPSVVQLVSCENFPTPSLADNGQSWVSFFLFSFVCLCVLNMDMFVWVCACVYAVCICVHLYVHPDIETESTFLHHSQSYCFEIVGHRTWSSLIS